MHDTFIQCTPKATILCKAYNLQGRSHFPLLYSNHSIQLRNQRAIAYQHKIIRRKRLCLNTLYCLLQIGWLFFVIYRHEN